MNTDLLSRMTCIGEVPAGSQICSYMGMIIVVPPNSEPLLVAPSGLVPICIDSNKVVLKL